MKPKLRFKGFTHEWEIKRGSELFINSRTKGNDKLPLYSVTLDRGMVPRDSLERRVESETEGGDNLFVAKNDISYNMMRMWQGAFGLAPVDCMVSPAYVVLHPKESVFSDFFAKYFNRSRNLYLFTAFSYGLTSDRLRLYFKDFGRIKFFVPSLPEQEKIASFLSATDEKIQQLTRKKELLEQYKKGVMQQLFTSSELGLERLKDDRIDADTDNPTIPKSQKSKSRQLRFKDSNGKPYPKWEEKAFEEIYSFYSTNSLSREKLNYESGSVKNIHYGDIHTKFRSQFIVNEEYVPYINSDVDLSKVKEDHYCREGDLVIADASEDYDDIGKSIELVKLNNEKVVAGLHTFLARPDLSKIIIGFSGYLVQASYVRMQVKKIAQGTKVLSLAPSRLGKVKLSIPGREEQQKIASFLTALDAKIESVATQIAYTQTFKKGLLQQMFV
jgi:type I restriction enzyme S subunit